jgi:hypothetical protein
MSSHQVIFYTLAFFGVFAVYFLPFLVAWKRDHNNETPIGLANLFFGWTGIGWIVCLIWAFSDNVPDE